ncbi:MAG: cell division protein ZapA [Paludibacteraceae bacterium]|nr:cell division protein ZapA [Paludibacteraceae bacterium]
MNNMPGEDEYFYITLKVLGETLKVPIKRSDEQYFRETAKLIELSYDKYAKVFSATQNNFRVETYLKFVALDLGVRYKMAEAANEELKQRLVQLEKDIDQHLN